MSSKQTMSNLTFEDEKTIRRRRRKRLEGALHGVARQMAHANKRQTWDDVLALRWLRLWGIYKKAKDHEYRLFEKRIDMKTS
jgi:hypothetical protein